MADVLGEAQQLSQDPPKVDKGKGRANTDEEEYNCSEVEGEDDDDYEPDAEEAAAELPGLERYKPRHKKTIHYNTLKEEDSEDDIMLGDYEEPHFGKDFVVVDDENVHITQAFGEEYIKLIVSFGFTISIIFSSRLASTPSTTSKLFPNRHS